MERRYREEPNTDLWWQIALGVFLALLAHSIVIGLYARYEAQQAIKALNAETAKMTKQMQRATAPARRTAPEPIQYTPPAPLRAGERCIQGNRFQRIENGWVQLPFDPC